MNILLNRSTRSLDMRAVSSGHSLQKSSLRSGLPRRLPSNPANERGQHTVHDRHRHSAALTLPVYDILLVPKI